MAGVNVDSLIQFLTQSAHAVSAGDAKQQTLPKACLQTNSPASADWRWFQPGSTLPILPKSGPRFTSVDSGSCNTCPVSHLPPSSLPPHLPPAFASFRHLRRIPPMLPISQPYMTRMAEEQAARNDLALPQLACPRCGAKRMVEAVQDGDGTFKKLKYLSGPTFVSMGRNDVQKCRCADCSHALLGMRARRRQSRSERTNRRRSAENHRPGHR